MESVIHILAEKRTSRLFYTCHLVFEERLGLKPRITTSKKQFEQAKGVRLNYSHKSIEGVLQIHPADLLFEKRVQHQDIEVGEQDGLKLLFHQPNAELGHDALAAVFFLVSRYEEYLPHREDDHGRFPVSESMAYKHDFVRKPIVDHYIKRVGQWLQDCYKGLEVKQHEFRLEVTVDVDQLFMFRSKGLARTAVAAAKDALLNQKAFSKRIDVLLGQEPDPLDIYDDITSKCEERGIRPMLFFQVGETSRYDINNPVHLPFVRNRINELAMKADIGIHPSYFTKDKPELLEMECERLRSISSETIDRSRQHYLRFQLSSTFKRLADNGIKHDYSMGFADSNGFRASTCFPFRLFDLERDELVSITIHPMVFMDLTSVRQSIGEGESIAEALELMETVRQVGGVFNTTWHPDTLIGLHVPKASFPILEAVLNEAHVPAG